MLPCTALPCTRVVVVLCRRAETQEEEDNAGVGVSCSRGRVYYVHLFVAFASFASRMDVDCLLSRAQ